MRSLAVMLVLCLVAASATAQPASDAPLPDQQAFLQEVRKRLDTDDARQSGYMYVETRRNQKLDKAGRSTGESVTVLESYPGLPGEQRWERVLSEDGRAVPARDLEKADRERQQHVEEYARKLAKDPAQARAKEEREREKARREREESIDELFRIFDVKMVGRERLDAHSTILFALTPRPNVKPRTRAGSIMRNFNVRAWISESDYELVRLEAEAIDTVSFGLGMLARVHKGSRATFERRKVNGEAWLPARATYLVSVRVGLVAVVRRGGTIEFSNYKKFGVDSTYKIATPPPR
jgi:hypothetical protein